MALSGAAPARAANPSADVSLKDLNLATPQGMDAARERLHQKARLLCSHVVNAWSVSHQPDYVHCVDDATAAAVSKLQEQWRVVSTQTGHPVSAR